MPLKIDTGERSARIVDLRRDADHDTGVGIAFGARILAHAVGDKTARLGRRRHDSSARAHAETVDRAAIFAVMHELIVGRSKNGMLGIRTKTAGINERLRMLDAHADGERLRLNVDAAIMQHLKRIARTVAYGEHDGAGCNVSSIFQRDAARTALACGIRFNIEIGHLATEAVFAAKRFDLRAQVLDDRDEPERADVRLGRIQNFLRATRPGELGQDLAAEIARVLDLAIELAVRETCPRRPRRTVRWTPG